MIALGLRPHAADLATVAEEEAVGAKQSSYAEWGAFAHHGALFAPVVDGEVLTRTPWDALSAGVARSVDLIVGHNRDESRVSLAMDQRLGNLGEQDAAHWISVFGEGRDYRGAYPSATAEQIVELVYSDCFFRMPTYRLAEAQAAGGLPSTRPPERPGCSTWQAGYDLTRRRPPGSSGADTPFLSCPARVRGSVDLADIADAGSVAFADRMIRQG